MMYVIYILATLFYIFLTSFLLNIQKKNKSKYAGTFETITKFYAVVFSY